ncbi:class I SAM-dependent methyltransferase [Congregibacter brevis]|uniref:Class I SAM-dependent methyltransferase n=1 Tax=Congregibacter brevis TaxID=3081201 RepID=A0ABZ0IEV4_9GAMM|nr:class I SAM-dependent methyltransferase [Congregibacter sp. IMCC45268]
MSSAADLVALQRALYTSRNPTRRYLHCARRDWVRSEISSAAEISPAHYALEVGPGSGIYLSSLAQVADRVVAIDVEPSYLQAAALLTDNFASDSPISCVQGNLSSGVLAEGSIDLILCSEVIEHVEDSASLIAVMAKTLKPQGTLILTTPQPYSPVELLGKIAFLPGILQLLRLIYREPIEPTGHINVLSTAQLKAQIASADLVVVKEERLGFYLPVIAEFGGRWGQGLLVAIDRAIQNSRFQGLLWTQCFVLRKPGSSPP